MIIKKAMTRDDIQKCEEVILVLRPHLKDQDVWQLYVEQQKEAFQVIFVEEDGLAVAFAGYRYMNMFYSAKTLYIDDLATLPNARKKGYANKLLDYIIAEATRTGCNQVALDSGHHRHGAHKLYLDKGFVISAHHFQLPVG